MLGAEVRNSYLIEFYNKLDTILKQTLDKNVIIFGATYGGEFIKWVYKEKYGKTIKGIVDRWESDTHFHVLHLMSLYYLFDENDIIINVLPKDMGPRKEFENIGEDWTKLNYTEAQIINLWEEIYKDHDANSEKQYEITFYDYLEYKGNVDLLTTIRRNAVKGKYAHGYYPTDFRLIYTIFEMENLFDKKKAILDIGCGKGASLIALYECGYKRIGGVEFTDEIYNVLIENLNKLEIDYHDLEVSNVNDIKELKEGINCYLGDASLMEVQLDWYNNYFFFNPFSYKMSTIVFLHIIESIKRNPRKIRIFYAEPICHQYLIDSGYFILIYQSGEKMGSITYNVNIYESIYY